ncbi:2-amino-4-hydroxy-6-hydroxymethyldihydropteridine diphosphokinase [Halorhodospira halochloris]|uniref:2-amino-4-hydroxy-6- hydroxymethyldihydropteridine diphosphokinase n=1 Tax=Halorhodospira halochloris TaxID=1052 RepID=UPI001EE8F58C|nr:2-amino-4-hydroxy-6-hydroxymethyldihydropteridine diphosphokinase [Halorhodospira halochloris]
MPDVYLSIGTNIDREQNVCSAMSALREHWPSVLFSPVYESVAVGFAGEDFFNLAAVFTTEEPLYYVLDTLRGIEDAHGRARSGPKFAARTLDLDLLSWGDEIINTESLTLPRAEILEHDFVLLPLAEIAPESVHPVNGLTYRQLWQQFTGAHSIRREVSIGDVTQD